MDGIILKTLSFGGGNTIKRKIIIDLTEIGGEYQVAAHTENNTVIIYRENYSDYDKAFAEWAQLTARYAESLQREFMTSELTEGEHYTLVYLSEWGFPVVEKMTYHGHSFTTYAQYSDVVKLYCTPYRKRSKHNRYITGDRELMIFKGWQDLNDKNSFLFEHNEAGKIRVLRSKYSCHDGRYLDDLRRAFRNPVLIYRKNAERSAVFA